MGPAQGVSADNSELVSPTRIWHLFHVYRSKRPDRNHFFDDLASFYLLHLAEFLAARPDRPACSYENLVSLIVFGDYRKNLVMLSTDQDAEVKENYQPRVGYDPAQPNHMYRWHLTISPDSPQAEQICTWPPLIAFCKQLLLGAHLGNFVSNLPHRRAVFAFVDSYQFLAS